MYSEKEFFVSLLVKNVKYKLKTISCYALSAKFFVPLHPHFAKVTFLNN